MQCNSSLQLRITRVGEQPLFLLKQRCHPTFNNSNFNIFKNFSNTQAFQWIQNIWKGKGRRASNFEKIYAFSIKLKNISFPMHSLKPRVKEEKHVN